MFNEPSRKALSRLPRLGANQEAGAADVMICGHFFVGACDWWVAEFDGKDTFFGFVNLGDPQNAEWGCFTLSELRDVRIRTPLHAGNTKALLGHLPLEVEWDEHWTPKPFGDIGWGA